MIKEPFFSFLPFFHISTSMKNVTSATSLEVHNVIERRASPVHG